MEPMYFDNLILRPIIEHDYPIDTQTPGDAVLYGYDIVDRKGMFDFKVAELVIKNPVRVEKEEPMGPAELRVNDMNHLENLLYIGKELEKVYDVTVFL